MELYLNQSWERIGISLSGGADSALLAYLILKQSNAEIYFTTQVRMWKTRPWQGYVAQQVVRWFRFNFPHRIHHIQNLIPPEIESFLSQSCYCTIDIRNSEFAIFSCSKRASVFRAKFAW